MLKKIEGANKDTDNADITLFTILGDGHDLESLASSKNNAEKSVVKRFYITFSDAMNYIGNTAQSYLIKRNIFNLNKAKPSSKEKELCHFLPMFFAEKLAINDDIYSKAFNLDRVDSE